MTLRLRRHHVAVPLTLACLLLATACGSTVQQSSQQALAAGDVALDAGDGPAVGPGLPAATSPEDGTLPGDAAPGSAVPGQPVAEVGGVSATGPRGSTGRAAGSMPGTTTGPRAAGPAATGSLPAKGFGWDAKKVYVGYTNSSDNAAASPLGYDPGNLPAVMKALADDVNRRGGLFGRQLEPVEFDRSFADISANPSSAAQAACEFFTLDRPVIAVLNVIPAYDNTENFHSCLAKKKVTELSGSVFQSTDATFRELAPYFYSLYGASWDRLAGPMMTTLKKAGYFSGWNTETGAASPAVPVKTALIYLDTAVGRAIRDVQAKALTAAGFPPVGVYGATGGTAPATANSFILDMRQKGVTHLLSYSVGVASQVAQSQGFFPRWGVSTYNTPQSLPRTAGSRQLRGSVGVGWSPAFDVNDTDDAAAPTPSLRACTDTLRRGGQTYRNPERFALGVALFFCDSVRLLTEATTRGGGLDNAALNRGVAAVGPVFKPSLSFRSNLSGSRQDLPGELRPLAFQESCSCYRYTAGSQRF